MITKLLTLRVTLASIGLGTEVLEVSHDRRVGKLTDREVKDLVEED